MNTITVKIPRTIVGTDAFELSAGTIVRVVSHKSATNTGDILIKTNQRDRPFVGLRDGYLWGDALEEYAFEVIEDEVKIQIG